MYKYPDIRESRGELSAASGSQYRPQAAEPDRKPASRFGQSRRQKCRCRARTDGGVARALDRDQRVAAQRGKGPHDGDDAHSGVSPHESLPSEYSLLDECELWNQYWRKPASRGHTHTCGRGASNNRRRCGSASRRAPVSLQPTTWKRVPKNNRPTGLYAHGLPHRYYRLKRTS